MKFLKDPLFHFTLIGILLFWLNAIFSDEERNNQIIINEYDINEVVSKWKMQWQREPTAKEMKGLMDSYIKQEILYREALALNLDHNDEIIKRRMAQKMKFLTEDLLNVVEPTEEDLRTFLDANGDKYRTENAYSFEQIYFNPDVRKDPLSDATKELKNENPKGDKSNIQKEFIGYSIFEVRRILGKSFTDSLINYQMDSLNWQGPIASGLGVHLILIKNITKGKTPSFERIKEKVKEDFLYDYQQEFNSSLMEDLLEKYEVIFELENDSLFSE